MPDEQLAPDPAMTPDGMANLDEARMAQGLAEVQEQFSDRMDEDFVVTEDVNDIYGSEEEVWHINTGRRDPETDLPKKLKVVVRDPGSDAIALGYIYAPNKSEAARLMLEKIVVSPKEIASKENWRKMRSAPRLMLTWRALTFLGVDGDFFDVLQQTATRKERLLASKLSTRSPSPTASGSKKSGAGTSNASPAPSSTPSSASSGSEEATSSTPTSPSPEPSIPKQSTLKLTSLK